MDPFIPLSKNLSTFCLICRTFGPGLSKISLRQRFDLRQNRSLGCAYLPEPALSLSSSGCVSHSAGAPAAARTLRIETGTPPSF